MNDAADTSKEKQKIEQAFEAKNIELLLSLSLNFIYKNIGNLKEHLYIVNVFKNLTKFINNNYSKYKTEIYKTLNHIGILAYNNSYFTIAINCYYLALLQCEDGTRHTYYYNIALCLHSLESFEKANLYYEDSIRYTKDNIKTMHYTLNYISCLIIQGKVKKANLLFNRLEPTNEFEERTDLNYAYRYVKLQLALLHNNNFELVKDEFSALKQILVDIGAYDSLSNLNNLILELTSIKSIDERKALLHENLKYTDFIGNIEVKRNAVIALIDFYRETNNKDEAYILFEKLLELDKTGKHEIEDELIELFLNMQSSIITHLSQKNELISNQKTELEEITYLLSHDLKTPLRTINSFTDLIERDLKDDNFDDISEYLEFIKNSSSNIFELIDDIAVLHKVESASDLYTTINLNDIVSKIKTNLNHTIEENGAKIVVEKELPKIRGVAQYIVVLFQNLVENGIKYNKSKTPTVSISSKNKANKIYIIFTDNGIGIDKAYHNQIFSFFKRLHNNSEYEGTGFGLGICKKIASKHDGEIKVQSKLGKGSTFKVILPDLL